MDPLNVPPNSIAQSEISEYETEVEAEEKYPEYDCLDIINKQVEEKRAKQREQQLEHLISEDQIFGSEVFIKDEFGNVACPCTECPLVTKKAQTVEAVEGKLEKQVDFEKDTIFKDQKQTGSSERVVEEEEDYLLMDAAAKSKEFEDEATKYDIEMLKDEQQTEEEQIFEEEQEDLKKQQEELEQEAAGGGEEEEIDEKKVGESLTYLTKASDQEIKKKLHELLEAPLSPRSAHEGDFIEDYMQFFLEPLQETYVSLSSISSSYISCEETELQRTVVIVKPKYLKFQDCVLKAVIDNGFQIIHKRVLQLTAEQASEIYHKYYGSPSFPRFVVSVSSGPSMILCIAAINAVAKWKDLIGPDSSLREEWFYPLSMRKRFGLHENAPDALHGSESCNAAKGENRYFNPDSIMEPIKMNDKEVRDYCDRGINKSLVDGCVEVVRKKPADPILYLANYLLTNNPYQPRFPSKIALSPT